METEHGTAQHNLPGKKEMRKQLADKISAAIPEMQTTLGDKKFQHRIKKAVKLITDGLHKKEAAKAIKKVNAPKAKAPKKAMAKKVKAAKKAGL